MISMEEELKKEFNGDAVNLEKRNELANVGQIDRVKEEVEPSFEEDYSEGEEAWPTQQLSHHKLEESIIYQQ
jgi:hypothetical protein